MSVPVHKALRPIAIFEACKGVVVLIAGFELLGFLNRDNQEFAEELIRHLHLDPAGHYAKLFITTMAQESDAQLMAFAAFAALYAAVRFAEAYGLWHERRWAEWLAALSGGVYIPVEIYELIQRVTWLRSTTLVVNVLIVAYMVRLLAETRRHRADAEKQLTPGAG